MMLMFPNSWLVLRVMFLLHQWVIEYKRSEDAVLDNAWLNTLLSMIGETFTDPSEVVGCVVSARRGKNRLALWTRTASDRDTTVRIGREWKNVIESRFKIYYQSHAAAMESQSTYGTSTEYEC